MKMHDTILTQRCFGERDLFLYRLECPNILQRIINVKTKIY